MALVLQTLGGNQALNLWGLRVRLRALLLWRNLTTNNVFTNIILLAESKKSSDLCGTLRSQALGVNDVRQPRDGAFAWLNDAESQHGKILRDDASSDRLPLALAAAAWSVAAMSLAEQQSDTGGVHDTLLHGKALLVVSSGDLEHESLELITDGVSGDFLAHATVHEDAELAIIFNVDEFLGTGSGVRDVELHLDKQIDSRE